jgi:hypothetical protein
MALSQLDHGTLQRAGFAKPVLSEPVESCHKISGALVVNVP